MTTITPTATRPNTHPGVPEGESVALSPSRLAPKRLLKTGTGGRGGVSESNLTSGGKLFGSTAPGTWRNPPSSTGAVTPRGAVGASGVVISGKGVAVVAGIPVVTAG